MESITTNRLPGKWRSANITGWMPIAAKRESVPEGNNLFYQSLRDAIQ
jgi:hypothetical protein